MRRPCAGGRRSGVRWAGLWNCAIEAIPTRRRFIASARSDTVWRWMESRIDAQIDRLGQFEYWLTVFGRRFHVVSVVQGLSYRIEVDGVSHRIDRDDGGVVHAPAPAVVVSIAVKPGDTVAVGDRLAVLEAMKMEMQVVAPFSGKVRQVMAIPNVQVDTGAPLLQIDPVAGDDAVAARGASGFWRVARPGWKRGSPSSPAAVRAWMNSASSCWVSMSIRSTPRGCSPSGARIARVDSDEIRAARR